MAEDLTGAVRDGGYTDALAALAVATRRPDASVAVLLVDVADVATLYARLGFEASTLFLRGLTNAFAQVLTSRGTIICFGDGRYCVIISALRNRGHAILAGEKLLRVADDLVTAAALAFKVQISIGIALHPSQTGEPNALLRYAQLAAASARSQSMRLQVYDEGCADRVLKSWELSDAFAKALDNGELSVFYQPKIAILGERVAGVEALSRWLRDGKAIASPDAFIPLAEEAGLVDVATWYVLSNALRLAAECGDLPVAVNISSRMLHHPEFMDMVRTAIATWGVKENGLTLEITEGALIADFDQASNRLAKLRDCGLRISIDDFGTGYSSLSYFKRIPADELKIDKSFVMRMLLDPADRSLVETIVRLARQFRLATVAEGVEDRETYEVLADMGCDYAQGYLFSPAISGDSLKEWLKSNGRESADCRPVSSG